jgi:hypothetical protein
MTPLILLKTLSVFKSPLPRGEGVKAKDKNLANSYRSSPKSPRASPTSRL